jgi:hypothetical protein
MVGSYIAAAIKIGIYLWRRAYRAHPRFVVTGTLVFLIAAGISGANQGGVEPDVPPAAAPTVAPGYAVSTYTVNGRHTCYWIATGQVVEPYHCGARP